MSSEDQSHMTRAAAFNQRPQKIRILPIAGLYFGHVVASATQPPDRLPTINAGTPWSEDDLADLKDMVREAYSPREIAEYLRREVLEVEAMIAERFG